MSRWDGNVFLAPIDLSCPETLITLVEKQLLMAGASALLANGYPVNSFQPPGKEAKITSLDSRLLGQPHWGSRKRANLDSF